MPNLNVSYIRIENGGDLPKIEGKEPFKAIVVIDSVVDSAWRYIVSMWLVKSGCLYMLAWGNDGTLWDDSVDMANLELFDFKDVPDDKLVMTTWHDNETLSEVVDFSKECRDYLGNDIKQTIFLHISEESREQDFLNLYLKPSPKQEMH